MGPAFFPNAEAGFFSNDLELFEEVVDLVGDKYVYVPAAENNRNNPSKAAVNTENIFLDAKPYGLIYVFSVMIVL